MILSVIIIAIFGIWNVGGLTEVWNRAVDGNRIFPPEYVKNGYKYIQSIKFLDKSTQKLTKTNGNEAILS